MNNIDILRTRIENRLKSVAERIVREEFEKYKDELRDNRRFTERSFNNSNGVIYEEK